MHYQRNYGNIEYKFQNEACRILLSVIYSFTWFIVHKFQWKNFIRSDKTIYISINLNPSKPNKTILKSTITNFPQSCLERIFCCFKKCSPRRNHHQPRACRNIYTASHFLQNKRTNEKEEHFDTIKMPKM